MAAKTGTYTLIASTTLGSNSASTTFSSVPITYTDLIVISSVKSTSHGENFLIQVGNGSADTATNYSNTTMDGDGTTARSNRNSNQTSIPTGKYVTPSANNYEVNIIHINDYANTSTYKTILARESSIDGTYTGAALTVGVWRSTSAINTVKLLMSGSGQFASGSTFKLYGIEAGNL